MRYFLSRDAVLKLLEQPCVYNIETDELYELDDVSFRFLAHCGTPEGCEGSDRDFTDYCISENILTEERVSVRRPPLIEAPNPSLRYLELQITRACNLRCRHCYIGDETAGARELSIEDIRKVLREFEEMQGLRVLISGGEPLTHNRFSEINALLPDFFVRKVLITNGLLLTQDILAELNVHEIQISVDGLEQAHDALRGRGTFRAAIAAIERAREAGFTVSVSTMVHAKNLDDFDGMERLFEELGVSDWTVDVPCVTGRLKERPEFAISPSVGGKYLAYGFGGGLHGGSGGFACGAHLMAVTADGKAAKCTFYADNPVGTIAEGLRANWEKIRPIALESLSCDCVYLNECRGGCRYRASLLGDPFGKDYYRCSSYGILDSNE